MLHFFPCLLTCMRPSCQDGNPLAVQDDSGLRSLLHCATQVSGPHVQSVCHAVLHVLS